jgi:prepilin-type N-terminal cleavage/methylation domain-containing protein
MKSFKTPSSRAFTLIELLTVIAVIGILAAIVIPTASTVRTNAKKTKAKAQFSQLSLALGLFKQEYGYYPVIPGNRLNGSLPHDATSISNKARQMLMLELLTGKDADPSTAAFESDEKNLTTGTPKAQNKKRVSFMDFAIDEVKVFDQDEKAILDAFGNLEIVVLVDRNGDGIVTDDEPSDTNGDGTIGAAENITEFPQVTATTGNYIESSAIKDHKLSLISGTTYGVRTPVVIYSAGEGSKTYPDSAKIDPANGVYSW